MKLHIINFFKLILSLLFMVGIFKPFFTEYNDSDFILDYFTFFISIILIFVLLYQQKSNTKYFKLIDYFLASLMLILLLLNVWFVILN